MDKIGILWILGGVMENGGTEIFLMNFFRKMDHTRLQIDFVVHGDGKGEFDEEIKNAGSRIYHVPVKSKNYLENRKQMSEIFRSGNYSIVHAHMNAMNTPVLKLAKECGIPHRISHAHSTDHQIFEHTPIALTKRIIGEYARIQSAEYATHLFACSKSAAVWLFGDYNVDKGNVTILPNAIDVDKFMFDQSNRVHVRSSLGINDNFVIGHVGRFDPSKNQDFLIEIFEEIIKEKDDARLLLIGDGDTRVALEEKAKSKNMDDKIIFTGAKSDLAKYFHAMDVFVLPSKFEGLGIALVEAQAAGLACVASVNVPKEADITGNVRFLQLNDPVTNWKNEIILAKPTCEKDESNRRVKLEGYDVKTQAKFLQNFYLDDINNK